MRKLSKTNIFLNIHRWPRIISWKINRVQWTINSKRKHLRALIYPGLDIQVSFNFFFRSSHAFSCVHALFFFQKLFGTCNLHFAVNCISKSFTANCIHTCPMSNGHYTVLSVRSNGHLKCPMEVLSADWLTRIMLPIEKDLMLKMQPMISNVYARSCPFYLRFRNCLHAKYLYNISASKVR